MTLAFLTVGTHEKCRHSTLFGDDLGPSPGQYVYRCRQADFLERSADEIHVQSNCPLKRIRFD